MNKSLWLQIIIIIILLIVGLMIFKMSNKDINSISKNLKIENTSVEVPLKNNNQEVA